MSPRAVHRDGGSDPPRARVEERFERDGTGRPKSGPPGRAHPAGPGEARSEDRSRVHSGGRNTFARGQTLDLDGP